MGKPSRYWTWLRLYSNGNCKLQESLEAKDFFKQHFTELVDESSVDDHQIQFRLFHLMQLHQPEASTYKLAEVCLRCLISHQTVQVCVNLVSRYGKIYGFRLSELLPWVLDNDGLTKEWRSRRFSNTSLSSRILSTYNPNYGRLTTWVNRLVQQDHGLNQFLIECGFYLTSDWAILNDTTLEQLQDILTECYLFTQSEVDEAIMLLRSYHAVYRENRRHSNLKGRCIVPNEDQLEQMNDWMKQSWSPNDLLEKLHQLANQLRPYRTHVRGGALLTESMDLPEVQAQADSQTMNATDDLETLQVEFLQAYRQECLHSLDIALKQVIHDRVHRYKKPEKGDRFLRALKLFYCERQPMAKIAPQVGLSRQDNVTNLLQLKNLRADVRRHMLSHLLGYVLKEAPNYTDPQRLQQLDDRLEGILDSLLEDLMQEDAKGCQTPKNYGSASIFAERLCQYLEQC